MNPCNGGGFSDFCAFYLYEGFAIPWSNANAGFCGSQTCIPCTNIATNPRYPIHNLSYYSISTGSDQAASIANVKARPEPKPGLVFFLLPADYERLEHLRQLLLQSSPERGLE